MGSPVSSLQAVLGLGGQPSTCQVAPLHNGPLSWDISCGFFRVRAARIERPFVGKLPPENRPGTNQRPFQACVGSRSYKDLMNSSWMPCIWGVCCSPPSCRGCCITCRNWAAVLEVFSQFGNGKQWCLSLVWECLRYLMRDIAGYLTAGTDCKFPQFVVRRWANWCGESWELRCHSVVHRLKNLDSARVQQS